MSTLLKHGSVALSIFILIYSPSPEGFALHLSEAEKQDGRPPLSSSLPIPYFLSLWTPWAAEMAQSIPQLPCRNENVSLYPSTTYNQAQ